MDYYCPICKVIAVPVAGKFVHPHWGPSGALFCKQGHMVYIRDQSYS